MFKVIYELMKVVESDSEKNLLQQKKEKNHCRARDISCFADVTLKIEKEYRISFHYFKKISG